MKDGGRQRLSLPLVLAWLALLRSQRVDAASTIFSILFTPSGDSALPTPEEYFTDMRQALTAEGEDSILRSDLFDAQSYLARVDIQQDFSNGAVTLQVCDLEPLWEKGEIVYDLKDCPFSTVKLVVYALVPAVSMSCGLLGIWSRQRNVRGRGKETEVAALMALGLAVLSVGYDWFFSWTLFRTPRGLFQESVNLMGMGHLGGAVAVNFLVVHLWFRRRFLVGMPWYEYHKHGLVLHLIFLAMYLQPQSVVLFHSRLFDVDVFNIHFGTPSKMNEVLSIMGCLSILNDLPQLVLQAAVWIRDETGMQAPKVSRVSMALSALSIGFAVKRQYIATVERQWYKEVVRMAGVRRLTTYGGASRWLKFQKRASAAGDVKSQSSTQQQLFLAWMQSMGRRQDSIFQDAATTKQALIAGEDEASLDSEDELDSLSEGSAEKGDGASIADGDEGPGGVGSEASSRHESEDPEGEREREQEKGSGSDSASGSGKEGDGSGSSEASVQLQSYRRGTKRGQQRAPREESPLGRRRFSGKGRADGVSSVVSESDIMAFAQHVAGHVSESGLATESMGDLDQVGLESSSAAGGSLLHFARAVARDETSASGAASGGDILGFARQVARGAADSMSGATTSHAGHSDLFAFARRAAQGVSESGAPSESGIFAAGRRTDAGPGSETSSVSTSNVSRSDVSRDSDIHAYAQRMARGAISDGGSLAEGTSQGALSSAVSGATESDIYAFARDVADDVSQSGIGSSAAPPARKPLAKPAAAPNPRKSRHAPKESGGGAASQVSNLESIAESDIFAAARRAAADASRDGTEAQSGTGSMSSIFGAARRAAAAVSASGVGTGSVGGASLGGLLSRRHANAPSADLPRQRRGRGPLESPEVEPARPTHSRGAAAKADVDSGDDIFGAARLAAEEVSEAGTTGSSIFGAARRAAAAVSASGVGTASVAGSRVGGGLAGLMSKRQRRGVDNEEEDDRPRQRRGAPTASPEFHPESEAESEDNIFAAAQRTAEETSQAAVSEGGTGTEVSSIFAAARRAAADISVSGVGSATPTGGLAAPGASTSVPRQRPRSSEDERRRRGRALAKAEASGPSAAESSDSGRDHSAVSQDLFQLAQGVADAVSRSGVQSASVAGHSMPAALNDLFTSTRAPKLAARPAPKATGPPAVVSPTSSGASGMDLFALARGVADNVSRSGVQGSSVGASTAPAAIADLFAATRRPGASAGEARRSSTEDVHSSASDGDLFAVARGAADQLSCSAASSAAASSAAGGLADLFARSQPATQSSWSQRAAKAKAGSPAPLQVPAQSSQQQLASGSSWGRDVDRSQTAHPTAAPAHPERSSWGSRAEAARLQPAQTSSWGRKTESAQRDHTGGGHGVEEADSAISEESLFAAARGVAEEASRSGVQSASAAGSLAAGGLAGLFSGLQRGAGDAQEEASVASSQSLFAAARGAADAISGVESGTNGNVDAQGGGALADLFSGRQNRGGAGASQLFSSRSNLLGSARRAADELSQSGLGDGSDILGSARRAADEFSQSAGESDGSDIFGAAQRAADEVSWASAGSMAQPAGSRPSGGFSVPKSKAATRPRDREFKPPPRRFTADGRHAHAPPREIMTTANQIDSDPPPWVIPAASRSPPVAPPLPSTPPQWMARNLPRPPRRQATPAPPNVAAPPLPVDMDMLARLKQSARMKIDPAPPPPPPPKPPPGALMPIGGVSGVSLAPGQARPENSAATVAGVAQPPPMPMVSQGLDAHQPRVKSSTSTTTPRAGVASETLNQTTEPSLQGLPTKSEQGLDRGAASEEAPLDLGVELARTSMLEFARQVAAAATSDSSSPRPGEGPGDQGPGSQQDCTFTDIFLQRPAAADPGPSALGASGDRDCAPSSSIHLPSVSIIASAGAASVSPSPTDASPTSPSISPSTRESLKSGRRRPLPEEAQAQARLYKRKSTRSAAPWDPPQEKMEFLPGTGHMSQYGQPDPSPSPWDGVEEGELPSSEAEEGAGAIRSSQQVAEAPGAEDARPWSGQKGLREEGEVLSEDELEGTTGAGGAGLMLLRSAAKVPSPVAPLAPSARKEHGQQRTRAWQAPQRPEPALHREREDGEEEEEGWMSAQEDSQRSRRGPRCASGLP